MNTRSLSIQFFDTSAPSGCLVLISHQKYQKCFGIIFCFVLPLSQKVTHFLFTKFKDTSSILPFPDNRITTVYCSLHFPQFSVPPHSTVQLSPRFLSKFELCPRVLTMCTHAQTRELFLKDNKITGSFRRFRRNYEAKPARRHR